MATLQYSASAQIEAPAQQLYAIVADYHHGHPHILPKPPFTTLEVEEGGVGAGTIIKVGMRFFGQDQSFKATITEPEPGCVLVETNDNGVVTSFTVQPLENGQQAKVTIATELTGRNKILGSIELWFMKRLLTSVYRQELEQLATFAKQQGAS